MARFRLYAGMQSEGYNLHTIDVECDSLKDAKRESKEYGYEIYYLNPDRDVMEIIAQEKVPEDYAFKIFYAELESKVIYYFEELVEINGEIIEVIKHDLM